MPAKDPRNPEPESRAAAAWRSLASSKTLWLAFVITLIGGGAWVYSAVTKPEPATRSTSTSSIPKAGLTDAPKQAPASEQAPRFVDRASPIMMRIGVSFMAGFLLAWGIRRFIKWTLLLAVVFGVGIYLLRKAGVFDVNYDDLQSHVDQGVDWARSQTDEAKTLLKRYVPSGAAAIVGMFFGIRR